MTEVSILLKQIAQEINKDEKIVQPFINILDENFYDTIESIKDLKAEDYEKWKFPKRIYDLIIQKTIDILAGNTSLTQTQKISSLTQIQQQSQNNQQGNTSLTQTHNVPSLTQIQQQPQNNQQVNQIKSQTQMEQEISFSDQVINKIQEIKDNISTSERLIEVLNFMNKIIQNIAQNPQEQKFRKIKQSNKLFQTYFLPNRQVLEFMYLNNFQIDEEGVYLSDDQLNVDKLNTSLKYIDNAISESTPSTFNPYQTYSSGNDVQSAKNLAQREGFVNYYDELQKLKAKRQQLMSQPVLDRKTRAFKQTQNQNSRTQMEIEESMEENEKAMLRDFQSELKKLIQNLDKQQFSSKSKQEYEKLLKDPIYTKCVIRIKFPQNIILEGIFCPMEPIKHVIDFVALYLENPEIPFYIFQTPPRLIFNEKYYTKTLEEMECLPGAVFIFGLDNDPDFAKTYYLKHELLRHIE